jgi:hypothetical protein
VATSSTAAANHEGATIGTDPNRTALMVWNPADGTTVELGAVDTNLAMTWTDANQIVLWSASGWQAIDLDMS